MKREIKHDKKYQQFTLETGDDEAELAYARPEANIIAFTHTYVPETARGEGLAGLLIEEGLRFAKANDLRVKADCEVVKAFFERHPEHKSLLK